MRSPGARTLATLLAWLAAGCASPFPVQEGQVLRITRSMPPLSSGAEGYDTTLQLEWLGTGCYQIQLGELSLLTDPFVSHQAMLHSGLGGEIRPDPELVRAEFGARPRPCAIFVAHSHWDHLLDLEEILRLRNWWDVPVYGSSTTRNLLDSYPGGERAHSVEPELGAPWRTITSNAHGRVEYMAWISGHAPHKFGVRLYDGRLEAPRDSPPTRATHFPMGEAYTFAFRLSNADASFTVFLMSSAAGWPQGSPGADLVDPDVAILCVPGWDKVEGYPAPMLRHLRAPNVVLTHFDNFFQTDGGPRETVPDADFWGCLEAVQEAVDYPGWRQVVASDVGVTLRFVK